MTFLRIVITLYLFDLIMIFSENRCPLFRIMLQALRADLLRAQAQFQYAIAREIAAWRSVVIVRLVRDCASGRTIQYPRDSCYGIDRPGRTGCPRADSSQPGWPSVIRG